MKQYIVDAFTSELFEGNPAAVCIMDDWISDKMMQNIAAENNLSDTAFAVKENEKYKLRWFTPGGEINLCGHATLATAYVLMNYVEKQWQSVTFDTMKGEITVNRRGDLYEIDFPAFEIEPVEISESLINALGATPKEAYLGRDLLCVFEDESVVRNLSPDMDKLMNLEGLMVHVTAKGKDNDCVSRSFGPKLDIPEDPVCGSGHCHIIPYWMKKAGKEKLIGYQASKRGGKLYCSMAGNRVIISGKAVLFSIAELYMAKN